MNSKVVGLRVPNAMHKQIKQIALQETRNVHNLILRLLTEALAKRTESLNVDPGATSSNCEALQR